MKRLIAVAALVCSACGGGATPDYYAFVIDGFGAPASCYRSGMAPTTTVTGVLESGRFSVWDGPEGKAFLQFDGNAGSIDMGDAANVAIPGVVEGAYGTGGWNFVSEKVTRATQGGATPTITERAKVTMSFYRGATFKGTLSASSSRSFLCATTLRMPSLGTSS